MGEWSTRQVLARQIGYQNTINFAENAKYLMMEHKDNADASKRLYTRKEIGEPAAVRPR